MIGYIKGKVLKKGEDFLVVDTGGVGYRVFVSSEVLEKVKEGRVEEFFICPYVRENKFDLYGLEDAEKMSFFDFLSSISGIGPKIALSLVKYGSPQGLKEEIEKRGEDFAGEVKGVGKKKLRKILLELTGKVKELDKGLSAKRSEAKKALKRLGFSASQAEEAVLAVPEEVEDAEKVVEKALKILGDDKKSS